MNEILTERSGSILRITLNRPAKKNAMTSSMYMTMAQILNDSANEDDVLVVLWDGAGDSFSAGNDLEDFLKHPPGPGESPQAQLADAVLNFDKPLIAAVNGAAAGGGFALAMLHDIRLASERATFTSAFVRIGLVAEMGLSYTLPRAIGLEAAMDVMFTGRSVSADEALAIGMVLRKLPHERLMDEAMAYAEQIAAQAPIAVQLAKRTLARSLDNSFPAQLELEWPYQVAAFDTDDA